jgi:hypothetical protein
LSVARGRCFSACGGGLVCDAGSLFQRVRGRACLWLAVAVPTRARSGTSVTYGRGFGEYEPKHVRDLPPRLGRVRRVRDLWSAF